MSNKLKRILSAFLVFTILMGNLFSLPNISFAEESFSSLEGGNSEIVDYTTPISEHSKEVEIQMENEEDLEFEEANFNLLSNSQDENFKFEDFEDGIVITGYNGNVPKNLEIPAEINGKRVLSIGTDAFKGKGIEELTLPEGIESLAYMAFQKNNIREIVLPSTLTSLGNRSLAYNEIENIDFPESLKVIGKESFMSNKIEVLEIPSHIREIGEGAFNNNEISELTLNDGLEALGNKAFEDNLLEEVTIPDTVTTWPSEKDNPVFRRNNNKNKKIDLVKVYNNSGATSENTFGIINPAEVTLRYEDKDGNPIHSSKNIVGMEHKTLEEYAVSSYKKELRVIDGSKEYLIDYSAPFGYKTVSHLGELEDNYFIQGREYTFEAEDIEGYAKADKQTLTLNHKQNEIVFSYDLEGSKEEDNFKELIEEAFSWALKNDSKLEADTAIILLASNLEAKDMRNIMNEHKHYMGYNAKPLNTIRNFILGNEMEYLEDVKIYDFSTEISTENDIKNHITSMLALNLLEENYNKKVANENLTNKIIIGKLSDKHISNAIAVMVDNGGDIDQSGLLENIKERLTKGAGNLESYTSLLAGYSLLNGDTQSDVFVKAMDYVKGCRNVEKSGYSTTPENGWTQKEQELHALKLFLTLENRESVFKTAGKKIDKNPENKNEYKIQVDKSKTNFKEFDEITLDVKTFLNNEEIKLDYEIVSDNTDVLLVKNDNKIVINNSGEANLRFVLKDDKKIFDEVKLVIEKVEAKTGEGNIDDFIDAISIYYNREHFKDNGGKLTAFEYATFKKAGLSTSRWEFEKDYKPSYDENLKYVGNKARQVEVMLTTGRNPRDYNGRDLISEIVEVLNTGKSDGRDFEFAAYPYLLGAVAVNNYNELYQNDKVNYNEEKVLSMIRAAQQANGGLIERSIESGIAPRNTALALEILSKTNSAADIKGKIISYFQSIQQENGGFFEKAYVTNYNADVVRALAIAGEDLTSSKWTKGDRNPIESLFYLYRSNNSFKDFVGEDMSTLNNPHERDLDCKVATQAVLEALIEVRKYNPSYKVKTAKISEVKEEVEEEIKVNTAILVLNKDGNFEIKVGPSELKINNKKQTAGLTALGALQSTSNSIKMNYGFVEEIEGIKNSGNSGWMYSINGEIPNLAAGYTKVKENDKIIWFYVPEELLKDKSLEAIAPRWEDISENPSNDEENEKILNTIDGFIRANIKQNLDSDSDKNILEVLDKIIKDKGYLNVELKLLGVEGNDEFASIDEATGDIKYFYKHPSEVTSFVPKQRKCEIELKLGNATKVIKKNPSVSWDKEKVRKVVNEEILEKLENEIKGKNESLSEFKLDSEPNEKIGSNGYDYLKVKYELEDSNGLKFKKGGYEYINGKMTLVPNKLIVKDVKEAVDTKLKVTLNTVQADIEIMTKVYDIRVLPKNTEGPTLTEQMQEKLNKHYTEDKLRCSVTGEKINLDEIVNDIKILRPAATGIEDYDNYKYFMTSSDEDLIKPFETKNSGKVLVYRPLPGEEAKKATLTINMEDKKTGAIVSKKLKEITVLPLSQEEIDAEINLMEKVKENYFELIKGENESKDKITKNLKWFREVNLGKDGLTWNTHIKDDINMGITPDSLDGWYDTEQWRIFRTSNPEIITHENLLVTRPEKDTKVKVDSILTSVIFGKYAEKYPNNEDFKKLYKQAVEVELTVLGTEYNISSVDLNKEIDFLKSVFEAYMEEDSNGDTGNAKLSLTGTGAAKLAGMDLESIQKNIYIDKDNKTAYQLSQSIITLIGADLDPTNYKGRNLVNELVKAQGSEGEFVTEYRGVGDDTNSIEAQIRSIIALDMAGAKYDEDKAIEKLLDMYSKKSDSKTYKENDTEGYMLLALSNHKDKKAVEGNILAIITRLSNSQKEDGSFSVKGIGDGATVAMARIIQGLVANDINPLSDERFIKNENTIVDGILKNKVEKSELKKSGYSKKANDPYNLAAASHIVFGALMDVKNQESMFKLLSKKQDSDTVKVNLVITKFNADGKYEVISSPQVVEVDKAKYNGHVTVLDALKESGLEVAEKGNIVTEIMGVGETKEEGSKWSGWMYTLNGVFPEKNGTGLMASEALVKDNDDIVWSRVFNYDNNVLPTMEQIKNQKVEKSLIIDLANKINVGEELEIVAKDKSGKLISNDEVLYLVSDASVAEVINGKLIAKKTGKFVLTASLKEDSSVKVSLEIEVKNTSSEKEEVKEYVDNLKKKYTKKEKFSFREALGYRFISEGTEDELNLITSKIELRDMDTSNNVATNIISIVAAGQNPYNYKGVNYVKTLQKSQKENGKFMLSNNDDYASTQAFALIALDMAKAKYKENTIDMLLSYQNPDGSFSDWKDIDTVGMVLSALGNHLDKPNVQSKVVKSVDYINQKYKTANIYSLAAITQGLIAVDEDINSEKWLSDGKNLVDLLIEKHKEALEDMLKPGQIDMLDEQVFLALVDAQKSKSMFREVRFNDSIPSSIEISDLNIGKLFAMDEVELKAVIKDSKGNILTGLELIWTSSNSNIGSIDQNAKLFAKTSGEVTITVQIKNTDIKAEKVIVISEKEFNVNLNKAVIESNKEAKSTAKIKNLTSEEKEVTLIVALVNEETDEIVNYSTLKKVLKAGEESTLEAGLLVPKSGKYEIKTFLWDSLENGNPIRFKKAA